MKLCPATDSEFFFAGRAPSGARGLKRLNQPSDLSEPKSHPVRGTWIETVTENRSRPLRSFSRHPVRVQARDTLPSSRPAENHRCCADAPACQATILYRLFRSRPFFPPRNVEITAILVAGQGCALGPLGPGLRWPRASGEDQATSPLLTSLPVQQEPRPLFVQVSGFFSSHRREVPQQRSVLVPISVPRRRGDEPAHEHRRFERAGLVRTQECDTLNHALILPIV